MKTFRYLAAGSLVALSTVAGAQQTTAPMVPTTPNAQPVQQITFQQAIDIALKQNVAVLQAQNAIENAHRSVDQARASIWPSFNFNVGGNNSIGKTFDPQTLSLPLRDGLLPTLTIVDDTFAAHRGEMTAVIREARRRAGLG